jgi:transposase
MRYELSEPEWRVIKPMLPNKPRGVPRVDDRRVLNGIFWVLRSGAPWRDLPENYGSRTTCYNRFVRWRRAGIWDRIMSGLATVHDTAVQMIDTSIVRVHQHGACIAENSEQHMGRSRGGLTSKVHAVVDANGLPVRLGLTAGRLMTIGSVRYFWTDCARKRLCWRIVATLPSRRIATRYDKFAANYLAFIKLASIRLWIPTYESTPWSSQVQATGTTLDDVLVVVAGQRAAKVNRRQCRQRAPANDNGFRPAPSSSAPSRTSRAGGAFLAFTAFGSCLPRRLRQPRRPPARPEARRAASQHRGLHPTPRRSLHR